MLTFHSLRYKNFLSTGNVWNSYRLDKHPQTLIVGKNGAGKTTLLDALCFGLYGKSFRKVTKQGIVNSINQKNLMVEIEFSTQGKQYLIRRGLKPTLFDIVCDGSPLPAFPSVTEMQEHLEKYILQCNYKAFTQVVILGASSYVPFMRLDPSDRREILEDVLDIAVFSVMQSITKDHNAMTREHLIQAQGNLSVLESQHTLAQTYSDQWANQQEERRRVLTQKITEATQQLIVLDAELQQPHPDHDQLVQLSTKHSHWNQQWEKMTTTIVRLKQRMDALDEEFHFFCDNESCPTCTQEINQEMRDAKMNTLAAQTRALNDQHTDAIRLKDAVVEKLKTATKAQEELTRFDSEKRVINERIRATRNARKQWERELDVLNEEQPPVVPTALGDLDAAKDAVQTLTYQRLVQDKTLTLLKDTGIRTQIIRQYLPVINKTVNEYLELLNFPVQFTLDDQFKETIKSRHRDEFSYQNFSEGEKRRIDLALVMTWRAIARLKNSVFTNLLIFDEIFDSSLDASGVDEFLLLLNQMGTDTNVIVISHKTESLLDKFSHVVSVKTDRGFSVITEG